MAAIRYAARAFRDLDRLLRFLDDDAQVTETIVEAIELLERHPLIGRRVEHGLRELVISRGRYGYVALYDFDSDADLVSVLAIRHQREAGYDEE